MSETIVKKFTTPYANTKQQEHNKYGHEIAALADRYPNEDWRDTQEFLADKVIDD